jgi:two-component system OmpR family response regulator
MPLTILVADDDPHIRAVLDFALRKNGHATLMARDGKEALALFRTRAPDLAVLDVGMPEMDGLDVCRVVRQTSNVPIIFLSARDEEIDRCARAGDRRRRLHGQAVQPARTGRRIGVILRRTATAAAAAEATATATSVFAQGDLRIDPMARTATLAARPLALTGTEFAILRALAEQPGYLFDRERLMAAAYGGRVRVSGRTIDSHIRNIRSKCAGGGDRPAWSKPCMASASAWAPAWRTPSRNRPPRFGRSALRRRLPGPDAPEKWRPSMAMVIGVVLLSVLTLPLAGMAAVVIATRPPAVLLRSVADNILAIMLAGLVVAAAAGLVGFLFWRPRVPAGLGSRRLERAGSPAPARRGRSGCATGPANSPASAPASRRWSVVSTNARPTSRPTPPTSPTN